MGLAEAREAKAREVFQRFDADKSGFLDHTELGALLSELHFHEDAVEEEFTLANKAGDGKIDFNEFVAYYNNLQARASGGTAGPRYTTTTRIARPDPTPSSVERPRTGVAGPRVGTASAGGRGGLEAVFLSFARFGGASHDVELDNVKFAKLARDCGLVTKKCTRTDIDLIFTQVKGKGLRKIGFLQFQDAVTKIGAKMFPELDGPAAAARVSDQILRAGGPSSSGTEADTSGVYGKMTDEALYTGAYKR